MKDDKIKEEESSYFKQMEEVMCLQLYEYCVVVLGRCLQTSVLSPAGSLPINDQ